MLRERLDVGVQAAEQESAVALEACDLGQVVAAVGVELFRVAGVARVLDLEQLAVVAEGPAVERAREGRAVVGLAAAQHRSAVAARVDQGVQFAFLVAADDDGLTTDAGGEVVADIRDLALVREVHPIALEDVLHLQLEDLFVGEDIATDLVPSGVGIFDECSVEVGAHVLHDVGHGSSSVGVVPGTYRADVRFRLVHSCRAGLCGLAVSDAARTGCVRRCYYPDILCPRSHRVNA